MDVRVPMPSTVRWAVGLLILGLVIAASVAVVTSSPIEADVPDAFRLFLTGGMLALFGFLYYLIASGRFWPVVVLLLSFVGGLALGPEHVETGTTIARVNFFAQTGLDLAALALLFTPSARAWFKECRARRGARKQVARAES